MQTSRSTPVVLVSIVLAGALTGPARAHAAEHAAGHAAQPNTQHPGQPGDARDAELIALLDRFVDALHERFPQWVGPSLGDERYNDRLSDSSPEAILAWEDRLRAFRSELAALDRAGFAEPDHLDADLLAYQLDEWLEVATLKRWQMPVNALSGPQVWLPQLGDRVPLNTPKHYDDYLSRLRQVPIAVGDAIDAMRLGIAEGRVPPRVVVEPTVAQAMSQASARIKADPSASPFFSPFRRLDEGDPRRAEAMMLVADRIAPVYEELALFLQNEYLPATRETTAIADGIDGPRAYEVAIREHTTLDLTPDQVHQIGLEEVARLRAEMMGVIARTDWPGNDTSWDDDDAKFSAFVEYLRTDERFYFTEPEDLLRGYRDIAKQIDAEMPKLFATLPRLPYGVREIPRFAAVSSPTAYYYSGSLEGGVPGWFMANTYALDQRPTYDMVALTLHEGVPGHHHQIALTQELEGVHPVRRLMGFTAFSEGWGLYAELLGLEVGEDRVDDGVYRGMYADPYDDFGHLNYQMWRAMRLVVDTGLHSKGWSRQRAIDYMLANSANTEVDTANEVNRYIGWPGQATAYMIGRMKIVELRERAQERLGGRFDIRAFHDALLLGGSIPLPVLEARIDRWIGAQLASD
ncbi:MAG: DUF885 domain-containing protein [Planctomycetota bacterium]